MFDKDKYLTSGVNNTIPFELQFTMWQMIDEARQQTKLDYLQVFTLSNDNGAQRIVHEQEQPEYKRTITIYGESPLNDVKVYVIDDGPYSTMLLSSEY